MDTSVTTHGGAVLTFSDVRLERRALTATLEGRRVTMPVDRVLAQKILLAQARAARGRRR
ncbi:MAG TPA: hypothetical protein VFB41_00090 [Solirubrobacteraceae bacterium]|nr:hypothetical protein [Solirubrobacteraceae bacterium]